MSLQKEIRRFKFREIKRRLLRKFPGAKTAFNKSGGFYVQSDTGRNLMGQKYPDLAFSDDVYTAWKALDTVVHWDNIEKRNNRGFRADVENNTVQNVPKGVTREPYEYHEQNTNLIDEEN